MQKYFVKFLATIQINYALASNHIFFFFSIKGKKRKFESFQLRSFGALKPDVEDSTKNTLYASQNQN